MASAHQRRVSKAQADEPPHGDGRRNNQPQEPRDACERDEDLNATSHSRANNSTSARYYSS